MRQADRCNTRVRQRAELVSVAEPVTVLIRAVNFPETYEQKLTEKQLTYQMRLLAESQKDVEDAQAVTDGLAAEIEAMEKEKQGDWDKELQEARSKKGVRQSSTLSVASAVTCLPTTRTGA